MHGTLVIGEITATTAQYIGTVLFGWFPAAIAAVLGTGVGSNPPFTYIDNPVTTSDITAYLQTAAAPGLYDTLFHRWIIFSLLSFFLCIILLSLLAYCVVRLRQIRAQEQARFDAVGKTILAKDVPKTQQRWERILAQAQSEDHQGWRLAILEADIMLNELLDVQGYRGETMADKMRQVERGDFNTIDLAWEAHRARNRVAHEGSQMQLNAREARRIIGLYEKVFREFRFI